MRAPAWDMCSSASRSCAAIIYLSFYIKSRRIHFEITTQRIKRERGLLSKVQESLELFRIDHFELPNR